VFESDFALGFVLDASSLASKHCAGMVVVAGPDFCRLLPGGGRTHAGQDSILLLALLAAAFACLNRRRDLGAGLLTGLGLFKFQIIIPMALLFLVWRRWRFCLGFASSSLVAGAVSVGLVGLEQSERYARSLIP